MNIAKELGAFIAAVTSTFHDNDTRGHAGDLAETLAWQRRMERRNELDAARTDFHSQKRTVESQDGGLSAFAAGAAALLSYAFPHSLTEQNPPAPNHEWAGIIVGAMSLAASLWAIAFERKRGFVAKANNESHHSETVTPIDKRLLWTEAEMIQETIDLRSDTTRLRQRERDRRTLLHLAAVLLAGATLCYFAGRW